MYWNVFIAIHFFHSVHIVREQLKFIMGRFLSATSILIFPFMLYAFHARYQNIMKNVSTSSQHEILETRNFTHSEVWAFAGPSEQMFLINRPLRAPRKLSWVYVIEMRIKKVKTPFYQPSSF